MTQDENMAYVRRTLHDRAVCVMIPVYNNAATIRSVVEDALHYCDDVIVVDDGSDDGTEEIVNQIKGIYLVSYRKNRGKGYALKEGISKALELGFAYAITMDADGQHMASDIPAFLEANIRWPGSIILGNRVGGNIIRSKGSNFANKFSNFWFAVETCKRLPDTQTGFRLYPLRKLHGYRLLTSRYEAELELIVFASWHGVAIHSIPVSVYYPPMEKRVSHFRPGLDFTRISILNTILCFLALGYALPLRILRFWATMLRTLAVILSVLLLFVVFSPLIWFYIRTGKDATKMRWHLHMLTYRVMRTIIFKIGIPGASFSCDIDKAVDFNKPSIIVSNHQSHLDILYLLALTPKIVFLTNDWVWHSPLYGFLIRHAGYLQASKGIDSLMPEMENTLQEGYSIAIFPEGTRSKDCTIGLFHQGAFYIAQQLGYDILPVFLYGPGRVLRKKEYLVRKSPVYIEVQKPFHTSDIEKLGEKRLVTRWFHQYYLRHYAEISNKIEQNV